MEPDRDLLVEPDRDLVVDPDPDRDFADEPELERFELAFERVELFRALDEEPVRDLLLVEPERDRLLDLDLDPDADPDPDRDPDRVDRELLDELVERPL